MAKATKSSDGRGQVAAHLVDFFCGEQKKGIIKYNPRQRYLN